MDATVEPWHDDTGRALTVSLAVIGALVGLAFAVVEYFLFGALMQRVEQTGGSPDTRRVLDWVRKGQLVFFPAVGFLVGPWVGNLLGVE
jgi:hypothetical protein